MTPKLKLFAILVAISFLILIIDLVRRRKLREEYSLLYLFTGGAILLLVLWFDLLVAITKFLDATVPASVLFLFALLFLLVMSLQYAVKLSRLTNDIKNLAQRSALMQTEIEKLQENGLSPPSGAGKNP